MRTMISSDWAKFHSLVIMCVFRCVDVQASAHATTLLFMSRFLWIASFCICKFLCLFAARPHEKWWKPLYETGVFENWTTEHSVSFYTTHSLGSQTWKKQNRRIMKWASKSASSEVTKCVFVAYLVCFMWLFPVMVDLTDNSFRFYVSVCVCQCVHTARKYFPLAEQRSISAIGDVFHFGEHYTLKMKRIQTNNRTKKESTNIAVCHIHIQYLECICIPNIISVISTIYICSMSVPKARSLFVFGLFLFFFYWW